MLNKTLTRIATNVMMRFSTQFATDDARKEYLDQHPDADPSNHTVKDSEDSKDSESKSQDLHGDMVALRKTLTPKVESISEDLKGYANQQNSKDPKVRAEAKKSWNAFETKTKPVMKQLSDALGKIGEGKGAYAQPARMAIKELQGDFNRINPAKGKTIDEFVKTLTKTLDSIEHYSSKP